MHQLNRRGFLTALLLCLLISQSAWAQKNVVERQINFAKGATSAKVRGQLASGENEVTYTLKVREGQRMVVKLAPGAAGAEFANVGTVIFPSGKQDGGKGGTIFDGKLDEAGEYKIRVGRNLMATQGGKAGFVLQVSIK